MKHPSIEDMETAAEWLDCNEGDNGEKEACSRVATWLTLTRAKRQRAPQRVKLDALSSISKSTWRTYDNRNPISQGAPARTITASGNVAK